jgi:hypothetical protein
MEYKVVLKPYDLTSAIGRAKGGLGTDEATWEAGEWNTSLNKYANEGWVIKNSGALVSGRDLLFWVLLEREDKVEGSAGF